MERIYNNNGNLKFIQRYFFHYNGNLVSLDEDILKEFHNNGNLISFSEHYIEAFYHAIKNIDEKIDFLSVALKECKTDRELYFNISKRTPIIYNTALIKPEPIIMDDLVMKFDFMIKWIENELEYLKSSMSLKQNMYNQNRIIWGGIDRKSLENLINNLQEKDFINDRISNPNITLCHFEDYNNKPFTESISEPKQIIWRKDDTDLVLLITELIDKHYIENGSGFADIILNNFKPSQDEFNKHKPYTIHGLKTTNDNINQSTMTKKAGRRMTRHGMVIIDIINNLESI